VQHIAWPHGYEVFWNPAVKKGYSGTVIFTRPKPKHVTLGIGIRDHDSEGRVITAEYPDFFLLDVYQPNSQRGLTRLDYRIKEWDPAFLAYLKKLEKKGKPVVFCGDLNVAHTEIDLTNPKTNRRNAGFTEEERGNFSKLLAAGFVDTFREFEKGPGHYSWWSQMMNCRPRNIGLARRLFRRERKTPAGAKARVDFTRGDGQRSLSRGARAQMTALPRELKELMLAAPRLTLAAAESLTCGNVQARVGEISGASNYFLGGITAYSLDEKVRHLGVNRAAAKKVNCVSARVAKEMARGVCDLFGSDLGVATTGYAEPAPADEVPTPFAWWAIAHQAPRSRGRFGRVFSGRVECPGANRVDAQRFVADAVLTELVEYLRRLRR